MKNILFITKSDLNNPKHGTPLRMLSVARQIAKQHNVVFCTQDITDDLKYKFIAYPAGNPIKRFFFFRKLIKQNNTDIILAHTEIELRMPVFLKLFCGVKIALDMHGLHAEEMYYHKLISNYRRWLIDRVIRFFLRFYDLLFICNLKHKQYYAHVAGKMELIYNGVELANFNMPKVEEPDIFTIGYAGNLKPYQGFDYVLQACQNIKNKKLFDFRLNLVLSSGTLEIKDILNNYGLLDKANLNFKIDHDKVNDIIKKSSVLVVPRPSLTMTEYAYPSKLPNDLLTGIVTITTNVGPVKDLFAPAGCCIVIETDDIAKNLEQALIKVHSMSKAARQALGAGAIDFVKNNLTWDILGQDINRYLEEV